MTAPAPVVILGGGLTGLSTAHHIHDRSVVLVEREHRVGGKARSERREGFTFDVTGHWLHLRHDISRALVDELFAAGDLVEIERRTGVFAHGVMLPYPFQANLHGLPRDVVLECLVGFVHAREAAGRPDTPPPRTFQEFAVSRFGAGIARHFFVPYNSKLWGVHPDELTPSWVSRYIPVPAVEQVIAGALGIPQEGLGYNPRFLYPKVGGIDALPEAFARRLRSRREVELRLGSTVESIDLARKTMIISGDHRVLPFETLISTVPLPEFVACVVDVPDPVRSAARRLRSSAWRYLDVAVNAPAPVDLHWIYVPGPEFPFFRVGIYSNAVPSMAPPGCSSLYVELADRTCDLDVAHVLDGLRRIGALADPSAVRFVEERRIPHAYVLFDHEWEASTREILSWIDGHGFVRSCGRYGAWIYNSMEDCILEGIEAARWAQP